MDDGKEILDESIAPTILDPVESQIAVDKEDFQERTQNIKEGDKIVYFEGFSQGQIKKYEYIGLGPNGEKLFKDEHGNIFTFDANSEPKIHNNNNNNNNNSGQKSIKRGGPIVQKTKSNTKKITDYYKPLNKNRNENMFIEDEYPDETIDYRPIFMVGPRLTAIYKNITFHEINKLPLQILEKYKRTPFVIMNIVKEQKSWHDSFQPYRHDIPYYFNISIPKDVLTDFIQEAIDNKLTLVENNRNLANTIFNNRANNNNTRSPLKSIRLFPEFGGKRKYKRHFSKTRIQRSRRQRSKKQRSRRRTRRLY
jgi:hypothetical protein